MRNVVFGLLVLTACPKAEEVAPPAPAPSAPAAPVEAEAPSEQPTAAVEAVSCALEIALVCAEGAADGCLASKTTHHVCVADGVEPGPPCEQEIAADCPEGQVDACTIGVAATHLCVVSATGSP